MNIPYKIYSRFIAGLLLTALVFQAKSQAPAPVFKAEKLSLNKGWRFHAGDIPFPEIMGHEKSYMNAKAGQAGGAAAPGYDDRLWTVLTLPHDWAADNPVEQSANLSQGFRKRGYGWYRRQFKLDREDRGKHLEIQFEGIATYATIWVNGSVVHRNWCGYTSACLDITAFAKYGDSLNTIALRVDADAQEGWWYEGAGIYRDTWLMKRPALHVITDGVYANPVKLTAEKWVIPASITLENSGERSLKADVELSVWDASGKMVDKKSNQVFIPALDTGSVAISLKADKPRLWSVEQPSLYRVKTIVKVNGLLTDSLWTNCGFRSIRFDADSGFYLNGKRMKIKGVCNHQDHAGVGVAMPLSIAAFRLKKLKEMGVNAYRCSHNPPSAAFLDLCDQMGILVMDENRNFNSSPEYVRQLQWMVRRDRNHPSIILWSVFNEEPVQATEQGYEMVRRMNHEVKKLDQTRPVTAAMNGGFFSPLNVSKAVDVVGFNYQIGSYDRFHKENPGLCMTSSEDVSAFMTRGAYQTDSAKHILDAYDTKYASWGTSHRNAWKQIAERPFMAGAFVWTGFDYHGEPSPFGWPSASSFFGAMDICGFPKTAFYIHQAQWVDDKPVLNLVPHWNWPPDSIGKPVNVMAMSNAETVKLFLNGKLVGEQPVDKYEMNTWQLPYQPGKLMAIGYVKNKEVSRCIVETAGKPVQLQLIPDRLSLAGNRLDAMPITVRLLDAKGRAVPDAQNNVKFKLTGPGRIIGLGNGDPNSHEPEKGSSRSLFNGLAQLIIQSDEIHTDSSITLIATSAGMKQAKIVITIKAGYYYPSAM
ncbi:MAG: beta-galactosidase GalA [Pedobacter sp.]|uniref:beta-galactosidase GalA n=1 Tax=Pedobacter sp. TaxID=1411316 RepID=UPI003395FCF8